MEEVLGNLVLNAVDAMGDSGTLTLSYEMPSRNIALITVGDTGCGIGGDKMEQIFRPYYTGYSDSRHMGLGLSYCQNVIKAHNGYIRVKSSTEGPDRGTRFILCIPQEKNRRGKRGRHGKKDKSADR